MNIKAEVYPSSAFCCVRDKTPPEYCGEVFEGLAGTDEYGDPTLVIITPEGFLDTVHVYRLRLVKPGLSNSATEDSK